MAKRLFGLLVLLSAVAGIVWLRQPVRQTTQAALLAYPIHAMLRTRNEQRAEATHQGAPTANHLVHRRNLATARERFVTTPNNDTLYSSAFLDLSGGPLLLEIPALSDRYHSAAIMDLRTDHVVIAGTRDGGSAQTLWIAVAGNGQPPPEGVRPVFMPTTEGWLLVRVLVDGPEDLEAARAAQSGFRLTAAAPPVADLRGPSADGFAIQPVRPAPTVLLATVNPAIRANPMLREPHLAATGLGGADDAFDRLPLWRQWLWRLLLPRIYDRLSEAVHQGSRDGDGWSRSPPGIGTAAASAEVRAGVALAGLGALPTDEAIYWTATQSADGAELTGTRRYRLTIPADMPASAFWSLSLYERMADGRLFYAPNVLDRHALGDRTAGLLRAADGSIPIQISRTQPAAAGNWLPAPDGEFTLIFRAYRPAAALRRGEWRLPPVMAESGAAPAQ